MPRIDAPTLAEHHAQRRADLVAAAVDLLHREGPAAVTPAAVATAAGLARSSVYQYYPSTGALVAAAVEEMFRRSAEAISDAVAAAPASQRLAAYVGAAVDTAVAGHFPTASLASLQMPEECHARIADLHAALVDPLVDALREAGVADPVATAGLVMGVIGAAATQVLRGDPVDAVRGHATEFVLAAVR